MVRARLGLKLLLIILILTLLSLLALGAREEVIRARHGDITRIGFRVMDPDGPYPVICTITNNDSRGLVVPRRVTFSSECRNWQPLQVVYLPLSSCYRGDIITVTCADGLGATGDATAEVAVNCLPVITIASEFPTHWRSDLIIPLTARDEDDDPITWSIDRFPSYGAVEFSEDTVIYHPEPYVGKESWEDSFTVIADDGFGGRAKAAIRVRVTDKKPQASGLSTSTDEDSPREITLPGSDPDNDPLQYIIVTLPAHGSLSGTGPNLTYTPAPNYNGPDSFSYKASDTVLESNIATVTITVNPVNDAPMLEPIPDQEVNEGGELSFTIRASDVDGDPLNYALISGPGSIAGNTYTYAAPWDGNHLDESYIVTIQASDGHGGTDAKSFRLVVHDINRPPSLEGIPDQEVNEGASLSFAVSAVDPDGDPLSYAVISGPGEMAANLYSYSAPWDSNHADESYTVTIQVSDGHGGTDTKSFLLTVHDINRPPTATPQSVVTDEDTPVSITLTGSDPDGDPLAFSILSSPAHGSLSGTPPVVTYSPSPNYNGLDSFSFQVADGYGGTATATVSITVNPVNDPPVAAPDWAITDEDTPLMIDVLANDSDPDGDPLSITSVGIPSHGTATIVGDRVRYDPDPGYSGTDGFTYTISDGHGGTASATVTVEVRHVNHPPVAYDDMNNMASCSGATAHITLRAEDPDGDPLTYHIVSWPKHGTLQCVADQCSYWANGPSDCCGCSDEFTFKVNDGELDSNIATIGIFIDPPEEP